MSNRLNDVTVGSQLARMHGEQIARSPSCMLEPSCMIRRKFLERIFLLQVSFGWGHALAQTDDGKLYGWGYSADGRLGSIGGAVETSLLESSANIKNQELSASTFEAAEKLVLEGMEKEKNMPIIWEPRLVRELHGMEVVGIACGLDHSLVLCGT